MWNLIRSGLSYHCRTLLVAWGMALGLGLIELFFIWMEPAELEPERLLLFPYLGFVATIIAGLVVFEIEDRERRQLLHLPLPVSRMQMGLARVVLPAVIVLLGTAATALLGCAILLAVGARPTASAAWQLLFATTLALFFLQLLLAFLTFVRGGRQRLRSLLGIVTLVMALGITAVAWVMLAHSGSYLMVGLGTAVMTLGLIGLSAHLFEQRQSFTGG